jgi:metallo-beta-lactamase family protein
MKLSFHGAAREVTGSCNLLEAAGHKILVDCGMFQGGQFNEEKNQDKFIFNPAELSAVVVTHSHLDHVGRLPLLIKDGFSGFIYATPPTVELTRLILEDALEVMTYNNRHYGAPILYDLTDIGRTIGQFKSVDYHRITEIVPGIKVELYDAGHIFGSAFVRVEAEGKQMIFSGDIGNVNVPILRDTEMAPGGMDAILCESTYGDRLHESTDKRQELIEKMVSAAIGRGGVLMIPSFSLERTQELLYDLNDLVERKKKLPRVPIFLDSPLAINATRVYRKYPQYYDEEATWLIKNGEDLFQFPGLEMTETKEQSKRINETRGPKIIIAGAGMMNGGRIVHHALRYLSDERNTLLIIGYQAVGTLGRKILEGESPVEIMGERVRVRCQIKAIGALSAHGDQDKLLDWVGGETALPKKVYINHGEPPAAEALAQRLTGDLGVKATVVNFGLEVGI